MKQIAPPVSAVDHSQGRLSTRESKFRSPSTMLEQGKKQARKANQDGRRTGGADQPEMSWSSWSSSTAQKARNCMRFKPRSFVAFLRVWPSNKSQTPQKESRL